MNVLILEDEPTAANHLTALLHDLDPAIRIMQVIDSVADGRQIWATLPPPDLIFSDIQLADGLSFSLLEQVEVPCPIVFTTAYDEYAIRAFRLNSIDYLLKPIDTEALERSLRKYRSLAQPDAVARQLQQLLSGGHFRPPAYRQSFLVAFRDKLIPVKTTDIAWFQIEGGVVSATLSDKTSYPLDTTLDELDTRLDPALFFRANRQLIIARTSVVEAEYYFNGRLLLKLRPAPTHQVLVSKERVPLFRKWMETF
nr:LytTR family DNA-binding domain-containing protein [uncultured Arsenicibacter sp.]